MTVVCGVRSSESDRHGEMTYDWEAVRGGGVVEQADPGHREINQKGEESKRTDFFQLLSKVGPLAKSGKCHPLPFLQFSCLQLPVVGCKQITLTLMFRCTVG